jgi:inorganic pyrophosphatase
LVYECVSIVTQSTISYAQSFFFRGSVIKVKLLGAVALIDEGETDWKVLAIDIDDPLAAEIDDVAGLEAKMPGQTRD